MRFHLILQTSDLHPVIPVNYQYPLSAAIYKIIQRGDDEYAAFLHDKGYRQAGSLKSFKLFTFSDLKTSFRIQGDRFRLLNGQAGLVICFHLPEAAEHFIKGLFQSQQMDVADKKSRATFTIAQVESLPLPLTQDSMQELLLRPLSLVVCGRKNEKGNYDFLPPEHPEFVRLLLNNWKEKYKTVYGTEDTDAAFDGAAMEIVFYKNPPRSRLITIKAGMPEETRIRGFVNFRLKVQGKKAALELLLNSGAGIYNSLGMGCVCTEDKH